jgi:RimJ/RimL family protein N-acetyltransferase
MSEEARVDVTLRQLSLQESMDIAAGVRPLMGWADDFPQRGDHAATRYTSYVTDTDALPWSASWLIVADGLVVGTIGFKGGPVNGELEVGYGVVPSHQRRGVATNALARLLDVVGERGLPITAETAAENIASQRVVTKNGFKETERRTTDQDGELIVWRRELVADSDG